MARRGRRVMVWSMLSLLLAATGCIGQNGDGSLAEQVQAFAVDFLRQALAAYLT